MAVLTLSEILRATRGRLESTLRSGSVSGVSIDSRRVGTGELFIAIEGQRLDGHDFVAEALENGALYAVVSRTNRIAGGDLASRLIKVADTRVALGQLAAHYRNQLSATVVAVTGTNGKTTTKAMIGHILAGHKQGRCAHKSYNNDIGLPLTLLSAEPRDDYLVVEVGSNSPGEIGHLGALVRPNIVVITNVSEAHLDGLGDLQGVVHEKLSLLTHLQGRGLAVVNTDSPELLERLHQMENLNLITVGERDDADLRITSLRQQGRAIRFNINGRFDVHIPVLGKHNAGNALCAIAVGRRLGLSIEETADRLSTFELPDMRLQVHQYGSMIVVNDSYNANPASMRCAIEALEAMNVPGRRVAIIGDMRELGKQAETLHRELGRLIASSEVDVLMSVGDFAEDVCESARARGNRKLELHASRNVEDLEKNLRRRLKAKDTILIKGSRALQLERILARLPRETPKRGSKPRARQPRTSRG